MNVDGNTFVVLGAALGVMASIYYAVRKVTAAELGIGDARTKVNSMEPRVRALEDRLLLLENDHKNHAANDDRVLGEIRKQLGGLVESFEDMRQSVADVAAALRVSRGRDGKNERQS